MERAGGGRGRERGPGEVVLVGELAGPGAVVDAGDERGLESTVLGVCSRGC